MAIDINEDMEDLDDMEMDDLDLPCPTIKERESEASVSSLSLHRNISFGPTKTHEKMQDMKLEQKTKMEEEKTLPKPVKANSIANFLKNNLKPGGTKMLGFESEQLPLLMSKSNEPTLEKKPTFKPIKTILEPERQLDHGDPDSMDFDEDDMDLDDIPEPSLK